MAIAMAPGQTEVVVYEGKVPENILWFMTAVTNVWQFSSSWGFQVSGSSATALAVMALRGQSFFNASGDSDSNTPYPYNGGTPCTNLPYGSCCHPQLMSVGGTTLTTGSPGCYYTSEAVWNYGMINGHPVGSGGGICAYPIPSWQIGAANAQNHGSTTRRNFPDVALTADNIYIRYGNGQSAIGAGTSAAAPLWAAYIALVNQQAAAEGAWSVGFINPILYATGMGKAGALFRDIATGANSWPCYPSNYPAVTAAGPTR